MKHPHQPDHAPAPGPQRVPVTFELAHPAAIRVRVAGIFNYWLPEPKTLHSAGHLVVAKTLPRLLLQIAISAQTKIL